MCLFLLYSLAVTCVARVRLDSHAIDELAHATSAFQLCALSLDDGGNGSISSDCRRALYNGHENRCFDTCISLAVNEEGGVSVNWEHAWGDGHTMMHITQLLLQFARSLPAPAPSPMPYTSPSLRPQPHSPIFPLHLPFNLNPTIQSAIARSLAAGATCLLSTHTEHCVP
jgi:hypothetical protein